MAKKRKYPKLIHRAMYKCDHCGLMYYDESWAKKCKAWCKTHDGPSATNISHAVTHKFLE